MTPENIDKANRAHRALITYRGDEHPDESNIRDLIADLLHLVEVMNYPEHEGADDSSEKAYNQHRIAWDAYEADREEA